MTKSKLTSVDTRDSSIWFSDRKRHTELRLNFDNDRHHVMPLEEGITPEQVVTRLIILARSIEKDIRGGKL